MPARPLPPRRPIFWQTVGWGVLLALLQSALFLIPFLQRKDLVIWPPVLVGGLLYVAIPFFAGLLLGWRTQDRQQATQAGSEIAGVAIILMLPLPVLMTVIWINIQQ